MLRVFNNLMNLFLKVSIELFTESFDVSIAVVNINRAEYRPFLLFLSQCF